MQKVERKSHRSGASRRLLWFAAAALLLISAAAAVFLSRNSRPELPVHEDPSGTLISRPAEELLSVTVQQRGKDPWTMARAEGGEWIVSGQPGEDAWTVDKQQGTMLTEAMTQLLYEQILTDDPAAWRDSPGEFGLAEPAVSVTGHYSDHTEITVHLGSETGLEEGWYYLSVEGLSEGEDSCLYAVSPGIAEDLNVELALLHPVPRPEILPSLLDRITILGRDGEPAAEWTLRGKITDSDAADNWAVTVPFLYPADEDAVLSLKKSAGNLRLGVYTAPASEENLARCGLSEPACTLVFHMAAGSTGTVGETGVYDITEHEEQTVILQVGDARDELADYVRFGDEIFTVPRFTLSVFTNPDPMGCVARYPVLTPFESLESLTVTLHEAPGSGGDSGSMEYTLSIREPDGEGDEEQAGTRTCLLNGTEISCTAFEAAYQRMLAVTFSGVLPKDAEWAAPYKKYTFRTLSGGTHTIELSDWDGIHDAVTVDGCTLFYLIKGGMTALPHESGADQ